MNFETAYRINSAASWIGLALLGVRTLVDERHAVTIREVSLAQMQTAREVIEAANAAASAASRAGGASCTIHCTCEDRLLANVKAYADAFQL